MLSWRVLKIHGEVEILVPSGWTIVDVLVISSGSLVFLKPKGVVDGTNKQTVIQFLLMLGLVTNGPSSTRHAYGLDFVVYIPVNRRGNSLHYRVNRRPPTFNLKVIGGWTWVLVVVMRNVPFTNVVVPTLDSLRRNWTMLLDVFWNRDLILQNRVVQRTPLPFRMVSAAQFLLLLYFHRVVNHSLKLSLVQNQFVIRFVIQSRSCSCPCQSWVLGRLSLLSIFLNCLRFKLLRR